MSYLAQSAMTVDTFLYQRIAACAATLGVKDAYIWAGAHIWELVAIPEWLTAYKQVFDVNEMINDGAAFTPIAGADETAITDTMIKTAVETLLATTPPETTTLETL